MAVNSFIASSLFSSCHAPPDASPENVASPVVSAAGAHRAVFDDFIRAMRTGGRPCCDGAEGRRSLEVIEAIYRTSTTERRSRSPASGR